VEELQGEHIVSPLAEAIIYAALIVSFALALSILLSSRKKPRNIGGKPF
jgi:multisubunit Na+/H+ antiporter MnhC subunit